MARQLRALVTLLEDTSLVPHIYIVAHNHVTPVSGTLAPSSDLYEHQASTRCTYIQTNTHAHKIKKINI